ncbi:MAG: ankyrin repeat domain-containing protein [Proteobacteria bacterium]|nr:ankyrin repeat domain-containing protein [Pseudomonadota bacterium]
MTLPRRKLLGLGAAVALGAAAPALALAGSYEDFFHAVNIDDARTVQSLLARGFDPNTRDEKGQVALYLALRDGSPRVAEALLAHPGLEVDAANAAGETPLMIAALHGESAWVQRLLARGAAVQRKGWTPLHYAAAGPEPRLIALLLARGAAIDARAPNGTTALMMAAGYGAIDGAALLLEHGADPRVRNDAGLAAADFARRAGRDALAARLDAAAKSPR